MNYVHLDDHMETALHDTDGNICNFYDDSYNDYLAVITHDDYMIDYDESMLFNDDYYHVDDLETCDCCNEYINPNDIISDRNITLCRSCYDEEYSFCESCEDITHHDNLYYSEYTDMHMCEYCFNTDDHAGAHGRLENWDYKPNPIFYGENNKLFFGVEIECKFDDMNAAIDDLEEINGIYLKEDSSVSDGLEIVTHPMSYNYLKNNVLDDIVAVAKNYSGESHGYGGMHVHIGRDKFSSNNHFSMFYDMINNYIEFTELIAQRSIKQWAAANPYHGDKSINDHGGYNGMGRYCAVNICNIHTVEIRIFNGNLRKSRILKNLEYVAALFNFSKMFTKPCLNTFLAYVKSENDLYPNLYEYIKLKGGDMLK